MIDLRSPWNALSPTSWLLVLLGAGLIVTGCDNTIEPFTGDASYSVYGYLSLVRKQQFIRVKPLHAPLNGNRTTRSLDATVTLKNLTDGTAEILKDSMIFFRDANTRVATHNYWTDTPIKPETKYRLTIEDSSGTVTNAMTTTPPQVKAHASPQQGNCRTVFFVDFPGIKQKKRILSARVTFRTERGPQRSVIHEEIYNASHGKPDNAFIVFTPHSFLTDAFQFPIDDPDTPACETYCGLLTTPTVTIEYTYAGKEWKGRLPERLTDPISSPTVTNGSGFFGSIARSQTTIHVDSTALPPDHPSCLPN